MDLRGEIAHSAEVRNLKFCLQVALDPR